MRATHTPGIVVESDPKMLLVPEQTVGVVALEIVPDLFRWIEFGSVTGERLKVETRIVPMQLVNGGSFMNSSIVPQEDDWTPQIS